MRLYCVTDIQVYTTITSRLQYETLYAKGIDRYNEYRLNFYSYKTPQYISVGEVAAILRHDFLTLNQ
jgi:hypothetical protein